MRLLILADHWGELGGGEIVAAQLASELVRSDETELAVLTTARQAESTERRDGLTIYRIRSDYPTRLRPLAGLVNPLVLSDVSRVMADFKPDVVHAWNVHEHLSYASLLLARLRGAATVHTFQDALPFCYTKYHCWLDRTAPSTASPDYRARPERCGSCSRHYWLFPPRNRLVRALLSRALDRPVAVSRALARALADNGIRGAEVIHNGLPLDDFPPPANMVAQVREQFNLGDELIVGGGRMGWFKGQHQLLEAFSRVAERRPAAQLALAGRNDNWYGERLKRRACELELADRVIFTGFLPRPKFVALLASAALFANLSLYLDPFPTVNLEAGAAGRAVVGTCFGGTPEVVLDGVTGRLVDPRQVESVAEALLSLLADPAARAAFGDRAAQRIREQFPMRAMVDAYASLFRSLA